MPLNRKQRSGDWFSIRDAVHCSFFALRPFIVNHAHFNCFYWFVFFYTFLRKKYVTQIFWIDFKTSVKVQLISF